MNRPITHRFIAFAVVACAGSVVPAFGQCSPEWLSAPPGTFASYGTDMPVDACTTWLPAGQTVPRLVIAARFASVPGGSFSHLPASDGANVIRVLDTVTGG